MLDAGLGIGLGFMVGLGPVLGLGLRVGSAGLAPADRAQNENTKCLPMRPRKQTFGESASSVARVLKLVCPKLCPRLHSAPRHA